MTTNADVLFEEYPGHGGNLGIITLNRPQVLNALNHTIIQAMTTQLQTWASRSTIKAVVIRAAEGRAFCAGGDLRLTYERIKSHDLQMTQFFHEEYQLNHLIFHYPKPYIALLDGITMGGGVGISIHGSHRIATDRLLFAMPETGIGFFPDVGGSYFLPRLPNHIGIYLGLTGARINSNDCLALGIAQHKVTRETIADIIPALATHPFKNKNDVTTILQTFAINAESSQLMEQQDDIAACFSHHTVEEIMVALRQLNTPLCQEAVTALAKKSPTSLKVSLSAMQKGAQLDFDSCMQQEYRLVTRFLQDHDFAEGIRAVIIDKDNAPQWNPKRLENITNLNVAAYFAPLKKELEPLTK